MAEVALNASDSLLVNVDRYTEVFDVGIARDACDIGDVVLRELLGCSLVQLQIPHSAEVVKLLNRLGHLRLQSNMIKF